MQAKDFTKQELFDRKLGDDFIDWGLKYINVESAWNYTKGEDVKVAVLDTGINLSHPDLIDNIVLAKDFTGSPVGAEDVAGHGTHCAGIIAGVDNGLGIIGVAPSAKLYAGKVLGDNGNGSYDWIIKGIQWAMENDVDIISMSLGSAGAPPRQLHKVIKQAYKQGILMIAATGNENGEVCYPAAYDEVIAVSATDDKGVRANFSNYGLENEIAAPGVEILSTYKNKGYARLSGTSMATPIISGAAALYMSHYKNMFQARPTVMEVHDFLIESVTDVGEIGRDNLYGAGIINLINFK